MTFDAMTAAVDWLDAYKAGDLKALLGLYAENAAFLQCGPLNLAPK